MDSAAGTNDPGAIPEGVWLMAGKVIDYYAKFEPSDAWKPLFRFTDDTLQGFVTAGLWEAMDVVAQTAVDKYMVEGGVRYVKKKGGGEKAITFRKSKKKLNIRSSRLSRSILNLPFFGAGEGRKESIRKVKKKGGKFIAILGSEVPYAAIHEYGGTIHHTNLFGRGIEATIVIPPRPYLRPALKDSKNKIAEIIDKRIDEGIKKKFNK